MGKMGILMIAVLLCASKPSGATGSKVSTSQSSSMRLRTGTTHTGLTLFISELYRNLLRRSLDAQGLGFWVARYNEGKGCRDLAKGFILSQEFARIRSSARSRALIAPYIDRLYRGVLGRAPDQAGFRFWAGVLSSASNNVVRIEDVEAEFLNSEEFLQRCFRYGLSY